MSSLLLLLLLSLASTVLAFAPTVPFTATTTTTSLLLQRSKSTALASDQWRDRDVMDSSKWRSSNEDYADANEWERIIQAKKDGTFWSSFESSNDDDDADDNDDSNANSNMIDQEEAQADAWLDSLSALSANEVEFNLKEAERADTARQMEEWGFDQSTIANALDVATVEETEEPPEMQSYREEMYETVNDIDFTTVASHTLVDIDPDTNEPIRQQMVYVDEQECIGCTNCATIAQNTFFMEDEYGRARVFSQWGDDDETISVAIETCPVDCIHYVPYEELVRLEIEREGMVINFKSRLVGSNEKVSAAVAFSERQVISGNGGSRCNNCPSRGCKNCPMFGVGKNPEFERREKLRKEKRLKRQLEQQRKSEEKSVDL